MKNKQFILGAFFSYGAILFNIVSGLLFTPWMIDQLGDDQYALYTLAISVINIFLMDFGIGSAVTKFLSNYYAKKEYDEANVFMAVVYKIFIFISLVIALVLTVFYFLIDGIYVKLTPTELIVFKHLFIIVGVYSVISFPFTTFKGVLVANERFIEEKLCEFFQKFFNVVLVLIFLLLGEGVYALVLVHAFTNLFFLIVKYFIIRKRTRQKISIVHWNRDVAKSLFGYSIWTTVMSLAQRCIFNIMPTVIAAIIGSAEITVFSLASTLEGYVYTFASAINGMLMPGVSRILNKDEADSRIMDLMKKIGKYQICTIGLLYLGFLCLGKVFVGLWMGDGYEMIYWGALLLIFPSLISMPQQVAGNALLVKDVVREQAFIYVGMATINIVLSIVFINMFGIIGASLSICISYLFSSVCKNILYKKKLKIALFDFFKSVYAGWIIVFVVTLLVFKFAIDLISVAGWIGFVIKGIILSVIYLSLYYAFCIDKETRTELFNKLVKRQK